LSTIELNRTDKETIRKRLQQYFEDELNQEIGQFDAEFLIDFFTEEVGPFFYNQGLYDAQQIIDERVEMIKEAIYDIEQPTAFKK
jgi:uncharacterized protein (DUF2164 family)